MKLRNLGSENVWDYENGFYWFSSATRLSKLLAHYELYKSIAGLPGDIFELGVYKAASLVRLATFRRALENDFSRKIVGFDAFGKFPTDNLEHDDDAEFIESFENTGGDGLSQDEVEAILRGKEFANVDLWKGNIFDTVPSYLKQNPQTRIALLHLDMDVEEPTAFALEQLWDRVVRGGIVMIDDYNTVAGATRAVDAFFAEKDQQVEKLSYYSVPSFVVKK